jgi:hypothetical protein
MSNVATKQTPDQGQTVASELAPVDDRDIDAAETTMSGSGGFLAQFKQRTTGCPVPLAWVAVARMPGQAGGTIRLISGSYVSPAFALSNAPTRIAIPYPAPYQAGQGRLTALHAGVSATIALSPAWDISAQGEASHNVTWHSGKRCMQSDG